MHWYCLETLVQQYVTAMSHISDRVDLYRRTTVYVARILRALELEQWHKDNASLVDTIIAMNTL